MKNSLYFILFFLLFTSCSLTKQPVFVKIDNVKVMHFSSDTLRLKAVAFFENPNNVGGKISTDKMKVILNGVEVAQVFSDEFRVPAKNTFQIPLYANILTKDILKGSKTGFLSGLVNAVLAKKITIRIIGNLQYDVFAFKKEFLVDKTEQIKIKL
tara:strand:+ start:1689 stop:2153 length:465 start_codon:yes stop_codon:yes gene_type:complete